jgi:hypothetical protein
VQVYTIEEFLRGDHKKQKPVVIHLKKYGTPIAVGLSIVVFNDVAFAGIDESANKLYKKVMEIGKWVILTKGAISCTGSVMDGDFQSAKRSGIGYLVAFALLLGLPWAFDEIETVFNEMEAEQDKKVNK